MGKEIEIKFRVHDVPTLSRRLKQAGFTRVTRSTHEMNALYDLRGQKLRRQGELLRLRKYGSKWMLTHKSRASEGRHKTRIERETLLEDGEQMNTILRALGFSPTFRYEKYRAEWSDGTGQVVIDETPIGNFGEIEGPVRWIDRTAALLRVGRGDYMIQTYAELFFAWKKKTRSAAREMTFRAVGTKSLKKRSASE